MLPSSFTPICHVKRDAKLVVVVILYTRYQYSTNDKRAYVIHGLEASNQFDLGSCQVHETSFNAVQLVVVPVDVRTTYHLYTA